MRLRCFVFLLAFACAPALWAQDTTHLTTPADKPAPEPAPAPDHGWSWYTSYSESRDHISGWVSQISGEIRWDVNKTWSFELGAPAYLVKPFKDSNFTVTGKTTTTAGTAYSLMGDVYLHINFAHSIHAFDYSSTLAGTGPTGDTDHNISTGHATVDWNNHFEHSFSHVTPYVEAGIGNTSSNTSIFKKPYTSSGGMTHYKAGFDFPMFKDFTFEVSAYDMLPFGDQVVFSRIVPRKHLTKAQLKKERRLRIYELAAVAAGKSSLAADHGFSAILSRSLGPRVDFQVGYTRSIIQHLDQVTMSIGVRVGHITKQAPSEQ